MVLSTFARPVTHADRCFFSRNFAAVRPLSARVPLIQWNARRVGYVELMAVVPERRKRGIGEALIEELLDELKRARADVVLLDCPAEAIEAEKLYAKMGFETKYRGMKRRT